MYLPNFLLLLWYINILILTLKKACVHFVPYNFYLNSFSQLFIFTMVKIRLQRKGSRNHPTYRVVAADARAPRDGQFLEVLGFYHPTNYKKELVLKEDRVSYWLNCGAQVTDSALALIKRKAIPLTPAMQKKKLTKKEANKKPDKSLASNS